ncbi:histidine phosphatase family protein [Ancylobacter mangrovi]|uniref:histidine phosphatase family protein n=1 Tax=Ancylobacter mangrovi TaxID=2972472 RepID=UPI002161A0F0|nr:histidine phosphatase family protein [Ancylobacter mangrovi]MCS0504735.1 histidine phosphatase family protein [Ancylobacter mangrovi]
MSHRLILICHAATEATRQGAFPLDEPLIEAGITAARAASRCLPRIGRVLTSPSLRARQTAALLWPDSAVREEPELGDLDAGRWVGRRLADLQAEEPEALQSWLRDPEVCPHDGEPIAALRLRTGRWLNTCAQEPGRTAAVTHAAVIRCAMLHVLEAPTQAFWRIDVPPLSITDLRSDGRRWTLRAITGVRRSD